MIGVTLAFGGLVAITAASQFSSATASASLSSTLEESYSGVQVSLVYAVAGSPGSCPAYRGTSEGTTMIIALFNYGTSPFTPASIFDNGTLYTGTYAQLAPGTLVTYTISVGHCTHPSGQTILAVDAYGKEVQFGT